MCSCTTINSNVTRLYLVCKYDNGISCQWYKLTGVQQPGLGGVPGGVPGGARQTLPGVGYGGTLLKWYFSSDKKTILYKPSACAVFFLPILCDLTNFQSKKLCLIAGYGGGAGVNPPKYGMPS